jgi:hypothetical protein
MTPNQGRKPRYFIVHLDEKARAPNPVRPTRLPPLSIQVCSPIGGLSGQLGYADFDTVELVIDGQSVPPSVLGAAKRLQILEVQYVDENGDPLHPF